MDINYQDIITIDPRKRSGKPCIRGLGITVHDILQYLAAGMTQEEILKDFDYLTKEDIQACINYDTTPDFVRDLPRIDAFKGDPVEIQRKMRDEWD